MYGGGAYGAAAYGASLGYGVSGTAAVAVVSAEVFAEVSSAALVPVRAEVNFAPQLTYAISATASPCGTVGAPVSATVQAQGVAAIFAGAVISPPVVVVASGISAVFAVASVAARPTVFGAMYAAPVGVVTAAVRASCAVAATAGRAAEIAVTVRPSVTTLAKAGVSGAVSGNAAPAVYISGKVGVLASVEAWVNPSMTSVGSTSERLDGSVAFGVAALVTARGQYGAVADVSYAVYVVSRANQVWART